jgi:hypothetical protein
MLCLSQAFVCGRAASGLSCILVRVITKATLPDSPAGLRQSTVIFLGIASLIVLACVVVAAWLPAHAPGETTQYSASCMGQFSQMLGLTAHCDGPCGGRHLAACAADAAVWVGCFYKSTCLQATSAEALIVSIGALLRRRIACQLLKRFRDACLLVGINNRLSC